MDNYGNITGGVRKREAHSQMEFYDMFVGAAFHSALAIVGSSVEAEEIAQDTILKILQKTDMVNDDRKSMERMVRRISSNAAIDVVRRRKNFVISMDGVGFLEYVDEQDETCWKHLEISDIKDGVGALPLANRSVLALRLFEGLPFDEIAKMLAVKASTVRVQYVRGIAKLRQWLIKNKGNDEDR